MDKLVLRPDADGYQYTDGTEVVAVALDGGQGRYRRDRIGATTQVTCTWTLNPTQYQYWRAFYVTTTKKGALAFLCDVVSDDGLGPREAVCNFVPGSVMLASQNGYTYVMQASLEVAPAVHDADADATLVLLYGLYGDGIDAFFASLEHLTNVQMPDTIGA